jgi:putative addiction module component (TIGR02574 family)
MSFQELLDQALALPEEDRYRLLDALQDSLGVEFDDETLAELDRRIDDFHAGKARGHSHDEVKRILAELGDKDG